MSVVKQVLDIRRYQQYIKPHQQRIKADAGSLVRDDRAKEFFDVLRDIGIYNSCKLAISPDFGIKTRVSGSNTFVSKVYSLRPETQVARRNLLTYTEELDNAVWSKTRSSVSANATNNPFGVLSADKLIEDTSLAASHFVRISGITVTTTNYSASVYAKASERSQLMLRLSNYWAVANDAIFDLSSGTVVNTGAGLVSASITPVGNGWYRCVIVSGVATSGSNGFFDIFTAASGSNATNGDGTSGIYIWGAQLEVGSSASAYQRVIDDNSWDGVVIDATQTTSTNQPYLSGNIAPNEKWCLKNPNGGSKYMTHPTISFAANEAWSVTTVLNWNGDSDSEVYLFGTNSIYSRFGLKRNGNNVFAIRTQSATVTSTVGNTTALIGKQSTISVVCKVGSVDIYINGIYFYSVTTATDFNFSTLFANGGDAANFKGTISAHIIHAQALTPTQVSQLANYLMSKYPEIPSVTIGSQVWATSNCEMVATPQGNLMANVTANANVEKITNAADRDFSSDTGWWNKNQGVTIADGVSHFNNVASGNGLFNPASIVANRWHKITFTISNIVTGGVRWQGLASFPALSNGTFTFYSYETSTSGGLYAVGTTTLDVDNISIQEVGWSDSTDLYNAIYAKTSGTDEQKTYAAVKAAAMWCYYNNDAALGAVYGKLYNWYAVKLLQMDIDYYNAANPSTPWGWRVPTNTDFNTLATTLGGASVAGGKMKKEGLVYFGSPNTGATNSSGFTAIGAGYRTKTGSFAGSNQQCRIFSLNTVLYLNNSSASSQNLAFQTFYEIETGSSLRLIKN